jgi:hypothetical protein
MAKSKKESTVEIVDGAVTDVPIEEMVNPETIAIAHAMEQLADNTASVSVYRQGPLGYKDVVFLFHCLPSEWIANGLQRLQKEYGSGTYRVHVQSEDGRIVINRAVKIEALPKAETVAQPVAVAQDAGLITSITLALAEISKGMQSLAQMIHNQRPDPMQTLEGIKAVAEIVRPPAQPVAPATGFREMLDGATALLNLTRSMQPTPPANGETSASDLALTKGIDLVGKMFEQHLTKQPQPQADQPAQALPQPQIEQPKGDNMPPNLTPQQQSQLRVIRLQLQMANESASSGVDPKEFAKEAYQMIPDEVIAMLANDSQWFETIVQNVPECANFKPWYEMVRTEIVQYATEDGLLSDPGLTPTTQSSSVSGDQTAGGTPVGNNRPDDVAGNAAGQAKDNTAGNS